MNGDSYMSRGMASTSTLPRIRKHETDPSNPMVTDAGRYGSSRDHYVSLVLSHRMCFQPDRSCSLLGMIGGIEIETEIYIEEVIDDVQGRLGTEVLDHLDANSK